MLPGTLPLLPVGGAGRSRPLSPPLCAVSPFHNNLYPEPGSGATAAAGFSYDIEVEFTHAYQRHLLTYLCQHQFQLLAYRGASGPQPLRAGLPTWFAKSFCGLVGPIQLSCQPRYKVYVCRQTKFELGDIVQPDLVSGALAPGATLVLDPAGRLRRSSEPAPAGSIALRNEMAAGTGAVTVGLAAPINGEYWPFCAFRCESKQEAVLTPHDEVALFAAPASLQPGTLVSHLDAPGSLLPFTSHTPFYTLTMRDDSHTLVADWPTLATPVAAGTSLARLLRM